MIRPPNTVVKLPSGRYGDPYIEKSEEVELRTWLSTIKANEVKSEEDKPNDNEIYILRNFEFISKNLIYSAENRLLDLHCYVSGEKKKYLNLDVSHKIYSSYSIADGHLYYWNEFNEIKINCLQSFYFKIKEAYPLDLYVITHGSVVKYKYNS